ncbi:HNH endonuclease [Arthrobacter sp. YC-RL1]|uniref:HNH endonuclease signature motif containing protein n=1 Tax=Arthrobacter sp. YC-RL1 TaxID=1652545 RepID=UPI0009E37B88
MATERNGRGHRAYRRKAQHLRNKQLPCAWCGHPIDYTLPPNNPLAFTADHTQPLATGGHLYNQELQPMHRKCNATKGATTPPTLRPAG